MKGISPSRAIPTAVGTSVEPARLSLPHTSLHFSCFSAYRVMHGFVVCLVWFVVFFFCLNFDLQMICTFSLLCCHISDRFFFFLPPFIFRLAIYSQAM